MLDTTLDILESDSHYHSFTMDGHSIMIDDYLEMRPERRVCRRGKGELAFENSLFEIGNPHIHLTMVKRSDDGGGTSMHAEQFWIWAIGQMITGLLGENEFR